MTEVARLVAAELSKPVDPRVSAVAAAIAASHPRAARGVIFYGSCLRTGEIAGQMLDFYLIVSDYRAAYDKSWLATANRMLPPNVFPFAHEGVTAKYAVLSEDDLWRLCGEEADSVSVWARFAQPVRLAWTQSADAGERIAAAIARAPATMLAMTPVEAGDAPLDRWRRAFMLTYGAELRAERGDRPGSIVDFDPAWYAALSAALPPAPGQGDQALDRRWRQLRARGKRLTLARLAKASLTFSGGIDYLACKISRHSGKPIKIRPWQRRLPLLGAITLLPRLFRSGAIR